jgi:hypothetical protein
LISFVEDIKRWYSKEKAARGSRRGGSQFLLGFLEGLIWRDLLAGFSGFWKEFSFRWVPTVSALAGADLIDIIDFY